MTDIGRVLAGEAEGRRSAEDITLFDSTGLAIQDLAIAKVAAAKADPIDLPRLDSSRRRLHALAPVGPARACTPTLAPLERGVHERLQRHPEERVVERPPGRDMADQSTRCPDRSRAISSSAP